MTKDEAVEHVQLRASVTVFVHRKSMHLADARHAVLGPIIQTRAIGDFRRRVLSIEAVLAPPTASCQDSQRVGLLSHEYV